MLTTAPTTEMIEEWKQLYNKHHQNLNPNRKTGAEVNDYFCRMYSPEKWNCSIFYHVVKDNIMENAFHREKLPYGVLPEIITYRIDNGSVLVGIDVITGFFHIESENIDRAEEVYDDIFLFRGLDEEDLKNFFLTAQYIQCLCQKKHKK